MPGDLEGCIHVLRIASALDGERLGTIVDAAPGFGVDREDVEKCLQTLAAAGLIRLCKGRVKITWSGRAKLHRFLEAKLAGEEVG
ncbi:hypothetical protein [Aeropyrum camini]|uniref:Predicted transcriptional regulator n=1 Tax=Aeropyrum camini SY1 = JCM 12091 TaxID=1198449 RepID=U3TE90_9CREN|nr:hypothetical protein [Aeropyrum camini]BAN90355.1 predicted transcriptional regulator [Aeropyrum camini SY1 = JCM 12091]